MSLPKVALASFVSLATLVSFVSLATFASSSALADETSVEAPVTPRLQAVAAADFGLIQLNLQAGLRYDWFEADVGVRGFLNSYETYVGGKLLVFPEHAVTPYLYGQIGRWEDADDRFSGGSSELHASGALVAGGLGVEIHMGEVASFLLHIGVDHQYGDAKDGANKLEAGLGFGVRL